MYFFLDKIKLYHFFGLLCLFFLTLCSCSSDSGTGDSTVKGTGTYAFRLSFPTDIPRLESDAANETETDNGKIDCDAAGIFTISCTLFSADGEQIMVKSWLCSSGKGLITDIPANSDLKIVVMAKDAGGSILLQGESRHILIEANRWTEGEDIEMEPFDEETPPTEGSDSASNGEEDQDRDDYSTPEDCNDDDPLVNPGATEVPGNEIDENCDGIVENSPQAPAESFTIADLGMEFARISAGTFMMGSPVDEPGRESDEILHQVTLTQDYYIQTTEATQRQFAVVMGTNPSFFKNCGVNCPVESVSWADAQAFVTALNLRYANQYEFRLPSEAEWEYAARAGEDGAFAGGDITVISCDIDPVLNNLGWYCGNADATYSGCFERSDEGRCIGPQPAGGREPNGFGIYDMHGNVMEWCSDGYSEYPSGHVADPNTPVGDQSQLVIRGGSWYYNAANSRSARRRNFTRGISYRSRNIGVRLVCSQVGN